MTTDNYYRALKIIEKYFDASPWSIKGLILSHYVKKVEAYEEILYPIGEEYDYIYRDVKNRTRLQKQAMDCVKGEKINFVICSFDSNKDKLFFQFEWADGLTSIYVDTFFKEAAKHNGQMTRDLISENADF